MNLPEETSKQLVQFLSESGQINSLDLQRVTQAAKESGRNVIDLLIEYGCLDEETIANTISTRMAIRRSHDVSPSKEVLQDLPLNYLEEHRLIPIAFSPEGLLQVAISDAPALVHINTLRTLTGHRVDPCVVTLSEFEDLSARFKSMLGNKSDDVKIKRKKTPSPEPVTPVRESASDTEQGEVIRFVNTLLVNAIGMKASDIHLEPYKDNSRIRLRIDGILQAQDGGSAFIRKEYSAISTRIKIMAGLNIAERRLPQDGAIAFPMPNGTEVDLRISVLPTKFGERIVMRILNRNTMSHKLLDLGFPAPELERFTHAIDAAQGLVLVTGPTGSGKTTTLYGALERLNKPGVNILTAEDPIEFSIEGIGQVHIHDDIGLSFSSALRSFLRQDPEIILVGEIRDRDTADIAIKASLTGHLVLSTLHTNDAISSITRLVNMGIAGYLIAASLSVVVAQRLARRVCEKCSILDIDSTANTFIGIGFSPEEASRLRTYRGKGCDHCIGSGYKGRLAIYEVLSINDGIRAAITANADNATLHNIAIKDGFRTIQQNARDLVAQGKLSIEEYRGNLVFN